MKLTILDTILKSTVKFTLPGDCPDEIIDYHYLIIRHNIIENSKKVNKKIKSIFKFKNKK